MRFPGGKAKAMTLSYDDQQRQDKRFVEILNKNGLKCTFNINSGYNGNIADKDAPTGRMSLEEMRETYAGHEVAVHTLTHPFLEQLPISMVFEEVLGDRKNIERDFGSICRGMAYPYGTYNDAVVEAIRACGIVYSRTIHSTEHFGIPRDWLRLEPTCHHSNPRLFSMFDRFFGDHNGRAPWLFYLWGHTFEFDHNVENNNWDHAEKFCVQADTRMYGMPPTSRFTTILPHTRAWFGMQTALWCIIPPIPRFISPRTMPASRCSIPRISFCM